MKSTLSLISIRLHCTINFTKFFQLEWEWIFRFSTLCDDGFRLLLLLEFGSWFMRLIVSSRIWTALHLFANSALLDVLFSSYFFPLLLLLKCEMMLLDIRSKSQTASTMRKWFKHSKSNPVNQLELMNCGFSLKKSYHVFTWKQFHVISE